MTVLIVLFAFALLLMNSIVIIDAARFGVVKLFGKRTGRILMEGPHLVWPFATTIELVSMELAKLDIEVQFTTMDRLLLTITGSLQYRPDPKIKDDKGRNVFIAVTEDVIKSGIKDAVQHYLGCIGGIHEGEQFIKNRHALADLINSLLMLKDPPHLNHDRSNCGSAQQPCILPPEVDASDLINYYNDHWRGVRRLLADRKDKHEHSDIEHRYGIEVATFAIGKVDFSGQTKKDFEKQQQVAARAKAFDDKMRLAKQVQEQLGASAQEALNAADVSLDPAIKKTVVSVEGEAGVLGAIVNRFAGNSKGGTGKKGKE